MKKLLAIFGITCLVSCVTPTVNQVNLYGVVEDIVSVRGHYRVKAWCSAKEKYYNIITDRVYQKGETIFIK